MAVSYVAKKAMRLIALTVLIYSGLFYFPGF